jgi:hypothetical protein
VSELACQRQRREQKQTGRPRTVPQHHNGNRGAHEWNRECRPADDCDGIRDERGREPEHRETTEQSADVGPMNPEQSVVENWVLARV